MGPHRRAAITLLLPVLLAAAPSGCGGGTASSTGSTRPAGKARLASSAFSGPVAAAAASLGVTYGPYMGLRCSYPVHKRDCEKIGIDVAFRHAATSVAAVAGSQRIQLRTPGKHSGVRHHDWVGTFTHAGLAPGRPYGHGDDVRYVPVELRVRFASGRRAQALLPHVLLAPGWG